MITKMTGTIVAVREDEIRLAIGPFEYQILVPESVRRQVQSMNGQEVSLHISEYYEGNQSGTRLVPRKIGFFTEAELEFFDLFCTVDKIGAKKAMKALARPVNEIADAISRQDTKWLSTLPGIGASTAEAIATTLKRKIAPFLLISTTSAVTPAGGKLLGGTNPKVIDETYQALMALGLSPHDARQKLDLVLTSGREIASVEEGLKLIFSS
jgi:Holliday junction DNA helicase RuvA